jgi:DNA-binding XRE family transcriptional regulator
MTERADDRDGYRMGAHAVARDAAGGVWEALKRARSRSFGLLSNIAGSNISRGNMSPTRLSTVIRKLREAQDMTQEQLAKKAGLSQAYLSQLEGGYKKNPSLPALRKLARALGVPVTKLVE